ncbi:MAG: lipoyl synthase [Planctomycetota bacterium]
MSRPSDPPSSPPPSVASGSEASPAPTRWKRERLPEWLRMPLERSAASRKVSSILREQKLNTICEEARCPNRNHCYTRGTATFLILGDKCTRSCPFCSVSGGPALPPDPEEPGRVIEAVVAMGLRHVVVTSVNRDDLPDQGSGHFVEVIEGLRARLPELTIEVLIPDFRGRTDDMDRVFDAAPHILNHNLETVPRLYRRARPGARYERSLELLQRARERQPDMWVKSGVMVGLGETPEELDSTMLDLHRHGCQMLTVGQYLAPSPESLPVVEYVHPDRFAEIERRGLEIGFDRVFSGPFVRSSYMADVQVPLS